VSDLNSATKFTYLRSENLTHYNLGSDPDNGSYKDVTACGIVIAPELSSSKDTYLVTCVRCLEYIEKRNKMISTITNK
jgi:hypothetical protein